MKQQKKQSSNHFAAINICAILLTLFFMGVLTLILPKPTVSEIEKRELAQRPKWSISNWFSGEFSKKYDAYYADTFPGREKFVSVSSHLEKMKGLQPDEVRIHQGNQTQNTADPSASASQEGQNKEENKEIDYNAYHDKNAPGNGLSGEGSGGEQIGSLFLYQNMGMQIFGSSEKASQRYAKIINSYAEELDGVKVYNLIAPSSIEFYLPQKYQGISSSEKENIQFLQEQLSNRVIAVDAYSEIEKHKEEYIYFRTDHHWTVRGAYAAYIAFCKAAQLEPLALDKMERHQIDGFVGTFYNQTQDEKLAQTPDFVEYFVPPTQMEIWRYQRGKPFQPLKTSLFASYATGGPNTYSVFLHGDFPLIHIKTDNHTGKKIMLVKESFGNAFAPFLVSHYDEVFIVDQRYFELNLTDFIKEKGITDLLILNNIFAINTEVRIAELEKIQHQTYVPYVPPVVTRPKEEPIEEQPQVEEEQKEPLENPQLPSENTPTDQTKPQKKPKKTDDKKEKEEKPYKSLSQSLAEEEAKGGE